MPPPLMDRLAGHRPLRVALIVLLFPVPLLSVVSASLVAMTTMRAGTRAALLDCLGAVLVLVVLTLLAGGYWLEVGLGASLTWGAAVLLMHVRRNGSLTLALQLAVLLGMTGVLVFVAWSHDPLAFWEQVLWDLARRASSAGLELELEPDSLGGALAGMMTGMMAASAVASSIGAVLLGGWWAERPASGVLGREFRELRLGRFLGIVAAVLAGLGLTGLASAADDLLLVLAAGFVVQGLAVVHWQGNRRQWPAMWVAALYLPLVLVPALGALEILALAFLGLLDNGVNLRRSPRKLV